MCLFLNEEWWCEFVVSACHSSPFLPRSTLSVLGFSKSLAGKIRWSNRGQTRLRSQGSGLQGRTAWRFSKVGRWRVHDCISLCLCKIFLCKIFFRRSVKIMRFVCRLAEMHLGGSSNVEQHPSSGFSQPAGGNLTVGLDEVGYVHPFCVKLESRPTYMIWWISSLFVCTEWWKSRWWLLRRGIRERLPEIYGMYISPWCASLYTFLAIWWVCMYAMNAGICDAIDDIPVCML